MMYKYLTILSLAALGLCACKPTPRIAHKNKTQQQQQQAPTEQQPVSQPEAPTPTPAQQPESTPVTQQQAENALLIVNVTRQPYNRLTPWEKQPATQRRLAGTYLGNGLVLTYGKALQNATYIELSLPDGTHSADTRQRSTGQLPAHLPDTRQLSPATLSRSSA